MDAAVIGVNKDGVGEVPRAFVVRSRDPSVRRLTAEQVYNYARQQLAKYKSLDGGVVFVEEIPRTASGKIQRFKLSQMNSYREMVASLLSGFEGDASAAATATRRGLPAAVDMSPIGVIPEGRVAV
jgi:hypothetical protein